MARQPGKKADPDLGVPELRAGRPAEAEELLARAVADAGKDASPDLLARWNGRRGLALVALERLDEAEPLVRSALERMLGRRAPVVDEALHDTITAARELAARLHERALALLAKDEAEAAEPLCRRALDALTVSDPVLQTLMRGSGGIGRAHDAAEATGAPRQLDRGSVHLTLVRILRALGRGGEAASELKSAIDATSGEDSTRLAAARSCVELGEIHVELKKPGEAGPCFRRALMLAERACGASSPELVPFLEAVGRFAIAQKDPKEARRQLERAAKIADGAPGMEEARARLRAALDGLPAPALAVAPPTAAAPPPAAAPAAPSPPPRRAPRTPEGALLAERLRKDEVALDRVELAAYFGDAAARDALGLGSPCQLILAAPPRWFTPRLPVEPDLLDVESLVGGAWRWPAPLAPVLALAAAEAALPAWRAASPADSAHEEMLVAARAYVAAPGEKHRAALTAGGEKCAALARQLAPGFKRGGAYNGYCSGALLAETCLRALDAGEPFPGAAATVDEAKLELAWGPGEKTKRSGPATAKALETLRAAVSKAAIAWALSGRAGAGAR